LGGWGRECYLSFPSIFKAAELYDLNETVHLGSCIVKDNKEWTVILSFIKMNICTNTTTYKLHIEWRQVEPKLNGTTLLFYLYFFVREYCTYHFFPFGCPLLFSVIWIHTRFFVGLLILQVNMNVRVYQKKTHS